MQLKPKDLQNHLIGGIVTSIKWGKDDSGYDRLSITFDTGDVLVSNEGGQAGYINLKLNGVAVDQDEPRFEI